MVGATEVLHVVHTGQSNAAGDDAYPVVSPTPTAYGNLQFARGMFTWTGPHPELRAASDFAFVGLHSVDLNNGNGELIANGLADQYTATTGTPASILFSFAGQGSKRLREISIQDEAADPRALNRTEGGYYRTMVDDVRRAKAQAERIGATYSVLAATIMQGEKNNDQTVSDWIDPMPLDTFTAVYAQDLIDLKDAFNVDVQKITGQTRRVPLYTYQTCIAISGQAQLLAATLDPEIVLVSPSYYMAPASTVTWFRDQPGSYLHLTGDSQRWLGNQFAKVIKRVQEGERWQTLRPLQAQASSDRLMVTVRFHVPRPPLVLDTEWLAAAPGAGFRIAGVDVTHAEVDGDAVRLALSAPLPARATLEYAHYMTEQVLPWGNLRDSDPERSIHTFAYGPHAGQPYPLWNWAVAFQAFPID